MIQLAKKSEIPEILKLTAACAQNMVEQGIYQWNESYPSLQAFERDIERGELYLLQGDQDIVGIIVISSYMDMEYFSIPWLTPNHNNRYIHRLAVHPKHQKKGYGKILMDFAEEYAANQGSVSVRLDTFSQNTRNNTFYKSRGYQKVGSIFFPKQSEHPFICYELKL
ncbi:dTDP-fucosamine acetyltransferase [Arenibacter antarcticus]|uniref:GNAT family N-acetyltransferase n=1 Tax=Arenibacter antarcticus TaxID=2040469 RepID=A0ABW5VAE6_9FLAO|nr:GNAT family N-acetyltransferase [Arenibacter sp. H213]MCM4167731.1 GNAT family N-acetyltransferase [Arenibacter sp. H213]